MANEKNLFKIHLLYKIMNVLCVPPDLLFTISSRFPMTGELKDDGIESFLKKRFLKTPGILTSTGPMDEKYCFLSFRRTAFAYPVTDLLSVDPNDWHSSLL